MTPKVRQSIYQLGTVVSAVLGLLLIWGGVSAGTADHVNTIVAGLVALLGSAAPATAAREVGKQRKDGVFDPAAPAEMAIAGVEAVAAAQRAAQAEVERVRDVFSTVISDVPVLGPLALQVLDDPKK